VHGQSLGAKKAASVDEVEAAMITGRLDAIQIPRIHSTIAATSTPK